MIEVVCLGSNVLSWFGHIERMSDGKKIKRKVGVKRGIDDRERSRKTFEELPKCKYEDVDNSERGERGKDRSIWRSVLSYSPARDTA